MNTKPQFDYAAIRAYRAAGMRAEDIAKKHGCHKATVYAALKEQGATSHAAKGIDWNAVQKERNAGVKATDLIKKYGISSAGFYTKTHPAGGKPPVIRARKFTVPTPSPFASAAPATNGHHKLVDEINANLQNTLKSARKERSELVAETATLDKMIARLEKAIQ